MYTHAMKVLLLTPEDVKALTRLRFSNKWDWPATFSCNASCAVWPGMTFGPTPPHEKHHVDGLFPALDAIVQGFLDYRPEGGRFHVDNEGVTVASDGVKIIEFEYRPT